MAKTTQELLDEAYEAMARLSAAVEEDQEYIKRLEQENYDMKGHIEELSK